MLKQRPVGNLAGRPGGGPLTSVGMVQRVVFDEPASPWTSPLAATEPRVSWFLESTRPEAAEGRRVVNDLYSRFPDPEGKLRERLRSTNDVDLMAALDELLVHDHLQRRYQVEYEDSGKKRTRPDFRLYDRNGTYVGAVEVLTLFLREDWQAEERRHAMLADALNARLRLAAHSVEFEVPRWDATPSARHMAKWIEQALDELRANPDALPVDRFGARQKTYSTRAVEIAVQFRPLPPTYVVDETKPVVLGGAPIGGCINSYARLRERLDDKAGKYDLRGGPFAIVAGLRDPMCDLDDMVDALIGNEALVVATGESIRLGNGFYGKESRRAAGFAGKHTRVSAVFAVQDWWPGGPYPPRITRFDNPFATAAFPPDALPLDGHWGEVERGPTHVRADWLCPPRPRAFPRGVTKVCARLCVPPDPLPSTQMMVDSSEAPRRRVHRVRRRPPGPLRYIQRAGRRPPAPAPPSCRARPSGWFSTSRRAGSTARKRSARASSARGCSRHDRLGRLGLDHAPHRPRRRDQRRHVDYARGWRARFGVNRP